MICMCIREEGFLHGILAVWGEVGIVCSKNFGAACCVP